MRPEPMSLRPTPAVNGFGFVQHGLGQRGFTASGVADEGYVPNVLRFKIRHIKEPLSERIRHAAGGCILLRSAVFIGAVWVARAYVGRTM